MGPQQGAGRKTGRGGWDRERREDGRTEDTGCFQPHYPEREIPQNDRLFLNRTGRSQHPVGVLALAAVAKCACKHARLARCPRKLTAFRQFCALSQEYPVILGISPLRIKASGNSLCPPSAHLPAAPCPIRPARFFSPLPAADPKLISLRKTLTFIGVLFIMISEL